MVAFRSRGMIVMKSEKDCARVGRPEAIVARDVCDVPTFGMYLKEMMNDPGQQHRIILNSYVSEDA